MATGERAREASLCDISKHNEMLATFYLQKKTSQYCDVVMKVCNRQIYAHSNVLAAVSPYFENFLSLELPRQFSQKSPQIIEIQVDGVESNYSLYEEAVADVINFIYTGMISVKDYNVSQIHEISKIMQLDSIMNFCEDFLQGKAENNTVYDSAGMSQKRDMICNTDITAVNFAPVPELWSNWSKSREPNSFVMYPKSKLRKMVSVAVQTTPVDKTASLTRNTGTTTSMHEVKLSSEQVLVNVSNSRKRCYSPNKLEYLFTNDKSVKETPSCETSPHTKKCKEEPSEELSVANDDNTSKSNVKSKTISTRSGRIVVLNKYRSPDVFQLLSPVKRKLLSTSSQGMNQIKVKVYKPHNVDSTTDLSLAEKVLNNKNTAVIEERKLNKEHKKQTDEVSKQKLIATEEPNEINIDITKLKKENNTEIQSECLDPLKERMVTTDISTEFQNESENINDIDGDNSVSNSTSELSTISKPVAEEGNIDIDHQSFSSKKRGRPKKLTPDVRQFLQNMKNLKHEYEKSAKEYTCTECDYSTTKVREMSSHMKSHKIDDGICFYCDMMFNDKEKLSSHLKTHKGVHPFICTECDAHFKTRTMLNLHLPKHSDDKPFLCQVCSMAFKWKHALKNHMVTHSNKREHLCDICGYSTAHKAQLKSHRLIHTGETFKCEVTGCKFETTKKQNLKYHALTHTRERPHQCEICGQNFSLMKNMKRHMLLHFAEKQHRCKGCDFASTRYDKLKEHMLKQHGVGTPPERRVKVADMLATSNINIDVQPDRFVSGEAEISQSQTLVIEPCSDVLNIATSEAIQHGVNEIKPDSDTYAILHKLLNGNTGSEIVSGEQNLTLLQQKNDEATDVVMQKATETIIQEVNEPIVVEQPQLQETIETHSSDIELTSDVSGLNMNNVTSIMLAPDGSQVINIDGEQCGYISAEELASKLGLPDNISISNLLRPLNGGQGPDDMNVVISSASDVVHGAGVGMSDCTTVVTTPSNGGILLDSVSDTANTAQDVPLEIIKKEETVQYMEVLVPETGSQLRNLQL